MSRFILSSAVVHQRYREAPREAAQVFWGGESLKLLLFILRKYKKTRHSRAGLENGRPGSLFLEIVEAVDVSGSAGPDLA
jgi:hypothetical protein